MLLAIAALDVAAEDMTKLTGAELTERISKHAVMAGHSAANEVSWMAVSYANGTRDLYWNDGIRSGTDSGTHRVVGDRLCVRWKTTFDGEERCFDIYRSGEDPVRYESYRNGKPADVYFKIR